ncbi:MAG TPA: CcdB family protein [Burkholderiaceae bacterium]|nr:CcdB family protein [Burkholderiaceae bacterium]
MNPTFEVEGKVVYADTSNMAAFPFRLLKQPVSSLRHEGFQILAAFDLLVSGV